MNLLVSFVVVALLSCTVEVLAANRYVRQEATGNGSGSDWTNAYPTLPGSLTRSDTYYVADGTYSGYTFDDATSGAALITIKKATVSDHGTATGWLNTFGDGVAVFTGQFRFTGSNYVIDGVVGGGPGSWTSGFGFKISHSGSDPLLNISAVNSITVRHIELQGTRNSGGGGSIAQDALAVAGGSNVTLSYFYTHAIGRCPFFLVPAPDITIEYGYIGDFLSTSAAHSEVMSAWNWSSGNMTFRHNIVTKMTGTGGIMWDNSQNHNSQARVYGNVFYRAAGDTSWSAPNGLIGGWTGGNGEDCFNMRIYNNTFYNVDQSVFTSFITRSGNNDASNNLFYNSDSPSYNDIQTHNYNHYINSGGAHSEANGTSATSGDPVVSDANLNFALKAATAAGIALPAPFNVDMFGNIRGGDGVWDRGAVEFGGSAPTSPAAPTSLRIIP